MFLCIFFLQRAKVRRNRMFVRFRRTMSQIFSFSIGFCPCSKDICLLLFCRKDFYFLRVLFLQRLHMVVVTDKRFFVVGIKASAFVPTKIRPCATDPVVVVANAKLLNSVHDSRFNNRFRTVVTAEGIVGVGV